MALKNICAHQNRLELIPRLFSDPSVPKPLLWIRIGAASERRGRSHIERRKGIKRTNGRRRTKRTRRTKRKGKTRGSRRYGVK